MHVTRVTSAGNGLRKLVIADTVTRVPYELIDDASAIGKALRAALAGSPEPDEAKITDDLITRQISRR